MCLGIPGKIVEFKNNRAIADIMGVQKAISTHLIDDVKIGDFVIIHAGAAISKVNENEALHSVKLFKEIKGYKKTF